jgi:hypothetical protein
MSPIPNEDIMILQHINEEPVVLFEVVFGGESELENVPSACEEYKSQQTKSQTIESTEESIPRSTI